MTTTYAHGDMRRVQYSHTNAHLICIKGTHSIYFLMPEYFEAMNAHIYTHRIFMFTSRGWRLTGLERFDQVDEHL